MDGAQLVSGRRELQPKALAEPLFLVELARETLRPLLQVGLTAPVRSEPFPGDGEPPPRLGCPDRGVGRPVALLPVVGGRDPSPREAPRVVGRFGQGALEPLEERRVIRCEVAELRVDPQLGQVRGHDGRSREAVFVELDRVGRLGDGVDLERDQAHVEVVQQARHFAVRLLPEQAHIRSRGDAGEVHVEDASRQNDRGGGESLGDLLEQRHVDPLGDRAEVAEDRARDCLQQGTRAEARLIVGKVDAVSQQQETPGIRSPLPTKPLGRDQRQIRPPDEALLQAEDSGAETRERRPVVHAVVDDRPAEALGQALGERGPEGKLDHADRAVNSLLPRELLEDFLEHREVVGVERAGEGIQPPAGSDLQLAHAGGLFLEGEGAAAGGQELAQREVEDAVPVARELQGELLRPLKTEVPVDDGQHDEVVGPVGLLGQTLAGEAAGVVSGPRDLCGPGGRGRFQPRPARGMAQNGLHCGRFRARPGVRVSEKRQGSTGILSLALDGRRQRLAERAHVLLSRRDGLFQALRNAGSREPLERENGHGRLERIDHLRDLRVVGQRDEGNGRPHGENRRVEAHREDDVGGGEQGGRLRRIGRLGDARPFRFRQEGTHATRHGGVVLEVSRVALEGNEDRLGPVVVGQEEPDSRGDLALPRVRLHLTVPVTQGDGQAEGRFRRWLRCREGETECRIGRDDHALGRHAEADQGPQRLRVAHRDAGGEKRNRARELAAGLAREGTDAHAIEEQRLALERGEERRPGIVREAGRRAREDGVRIESPVVVEEAASAEQHEVGARGGRLLCLGVAPRDRLDAVGDRGRFRISGNDDGLQVGLERPQRHEHRGENCLVSGVAEAVVAGDEDASGAHAGRQYKDPRFARRRGRAAG